MLQDIHFTKSELLKTNNNIILHMIWIEIQTI